MEKNFTDFAVCITKFLTDYLPHLRGYSRNTVISYKDALKMFIVFLNDINIDVNVFELHDFNREIVIAFLKELRKKGNSLRTANHRLSVLKEFAKFCQIESVDNFMTLQGLINIKSMREEGKVIGFLSEENMSNLINKPDVRNHIGLRHKAILCFIYDTAARVSEACNVRVNDLFLGTSSTVLLHGKGGKSRTVPISAEVSALLTYYIDTYGKRLDDYLFTNKYGDQITRSGIEYIIDRYVSLIRKDDPLFCSSVSPHMFRHSRAVHMLDAGIPIVYIRDFLGHKDISTTMIYAKVSMKAKEREISKVSNLIKNDHTYAPQLTEYEDILKYISNFKVDD
jgi:site-specific recombinase XerD